MNNSRKNGKLYQALLNDEINPVPDILRETIEVCTAPLTLSVDRYLSRDYYRLEVEKMWKQTWQATCRETEIANSGDYHVYNITKHSILIVRTSSGSIKGYFNACLHRGRQLRTRSGRAHEFKCPYHGFCWNIDGEFIGTTCDWDFPHINKSEFGLPEVQVDTWGGWVFINMDTNTPSLSEYLGVLPHHFSRWVPEDCYKAIHVKKVISCNWKLCLEAFIESHHIMATHPQIMTYFGDAISQYDVYSENISRTISPLGVSSPHIDYVKPEKIINDWLTQTGRLSRGQKISIPDGVSAREYLADMFIKQYSYMYKRDISVLTTRSEVVDAIFYSAFPNLVHFGGFGPNLVYRFKPYKNDHKKCTMEIMMLIPCPQGEERPKDCKIHKLDQDQSFLEAKELLGFERILQQDLLNLESIQYGLNNIKNGKITLSKYQEVRIRSFHQTLDKYVGG